MPDKTDRPNQQDIEPNEADDRVSRGWWIGIVVLTLLLLAAVGGAGFVIFPSYTDRAKFIVDAWLNILIVAAILLQVYIYFRQRNVMKQQWRTMLRQSRTMLGSWQVMRRQAEAVEGQLEAIAKQELHLLTQVEAAKEAADTAKRQLTLAEETLRTSQRAYVGLRDHPKLLRPILDGTNPTIKIRFFNAGNTPARDVEFRYKFEANGVEKPYIARKGNFTIFAGATKTILCRWNGQTFSDETQQWFKDGFYQLFFRGKLTYKDVWGVQQEPIRFYYFSINDMDLREDYEGDPDYASPDFEVEIDPDEEVTYTTDDPFPEPEEANKDPFDF